MQGPSASLALGKRAGTSGQVSRISRVFVFFVVSLRIQASELLRGNNPSEGEGQWSGVRGQMSVVRIRNAKDGPLLNALRHG